MSSNTQSCAAPTFAGEFRHRIEGKNRITIPATWRFAEEVELFMMARAEEKCISVMTPDALAEKKATAASLEPEERAAAFHYLGRNLRSVKLDKAGRISIPDDFCKLLGLEGEVMLSGALDTFRIWKCTDYLPAHLEDEAVRARMQRRLGI